MKQKKVVYTSPYVLEDIIKALNDLEKLKKEKQELKEWLEEEIKKSNYELETDAFRQVLERLG